jgi:GABA(A) receptor-associated protein
MATEKTFQDRFSFDKRKEESARIRAKYTDRIPVIVEKVPNADVPNIDKQKFLVPCDLTMGQFLHVIRKRVKLISEKALFVFVNKKTLPPTAGLMGEIYKQYQNADGFLYLLYSGESTFGNESINH